MKTHTVFITTQKLLCLLLLLGCGKQYLHAQKVFSEGIIRYEVFVHGNTRPDGTYLITVKNGFWRRELSMNSGYNHVLMYNQKTGNTTSLYADRDNKYALVMTATETEQQNKRFHQAQFVIGSQEKEIAGFTCKQATVKYAPNDEALFWYTPNLLPPNENFNTQFPGLSGLPLSYEIKTGKSASMQFVATLIETKSIDPKIFDVPKDYKWVTRAELENIK